MLIFRSHVCIAHELAAGTKPLDAGSRRASSKRRRELFDLTASNPTTCGIAYPEKEVLAALTDPRALVYRPESKGLLEAREAVAEYYSGRSGFSGLPEKPIDPERILLASGTSEAYSHIFRLLCEAGDEILVPAPSYPLFEFLADLADIRLVPYPLLYDHGWQIDFVSLRAALTPRSRAVLVVHPNNPTGSFVNPREAAELAEICAAREMAIVADEVFLDYASRPELARTFAFQDAALTFTLSGLSKISLLPQMKLAWTVMSGPEVRRPSRRRSPGNHRGYLSFAQHSCAARLSKFLSLRHEFKRNCGKEFPRICPFWTLCCANQNPLTRLDREGGWYAMLRVPVTATDDELAVALLERCSVLVHPGHFFNFSRDGFLVLSLISPENEFREGARRLLEFFVV